jgi:hypothetical protein
MSVLLALSIPGLVWLLVMLAAAEGFSRWLRRRSWLPWHRRPAAPMATGVGIEELDALFSATKRAEVEARASVSLLRDEQGDGAPPRIAVNLNEGRIVINRP